MGRKPGRLGVGVIGSGKVGVVLAAALRSAGHEVVGATAASEASRDRLDAMLPGVPALATEEVAERSELVLATVPDDVLPDTVAGLAGLGRWRPGQLVVHTSGRYGTGVLEPAAAAGAVPLAIHPAMTFTGTSLDLARLEGTSFGVTAAAPMLPIAQALVVEMGGEPVVVREEDRVAYHAALAHASNHLMTLVAQSSEVLREVGVEDPGRFLAPLLRAALDNALGLGESALTGPVARGDGGTVRAHLDALAGWPRVRGSYRALARATAERVVDRHDTKVALAQQLKAMIEGPLSDRADHGTTGSQEEA